MVHRKCDPAAPEIVIFAALIVMLAVAPLCFHSFRSMPDWDIEPLQELWDCAVVDLKLFTNITVRLLFNNVELVQNYGSKLPGIRFYALDHFLKFVEGPATAAAGDSFIRVAFFDRKEFTALWTTFLRQNKILPTQDGRQIMSRGRPASVLAFRARYPSPRSIVSQWVRVCQQ